MTKRIKLTEDNFEIELRGFDLISLTWAVEAKITPEEVIQQILDDSEKAEKFDILENAKTHEALVRYAELEQQNKQLKEKMMIRDDFRIKTEQKLEKLPDSLIEWQKQCVCDFDNNNNTHSESCKVRLKEILDSKEKE